MNKIQNASSNLIQTKVGLITQDWNIVPIGKVIKLSQYGLSISTDENGTIPIIGMKHLVDGKVEIDNLSCVSISDEEQEKFCLKKGDILLNRTNSYELVGKVSLFDFDNKLIVFASYLVRFQFDKNKVLPEFANYFLNSYPAQHYLKRLATKGVSQANINPSVFRKLFLLPIPPLKEQKKIAEILSTWDNAIAITEKLIVAKQKLKKGLIQKLLTGEIQHNQFMYSVNQDAKNINRVDTGFGISNCFKNIPNNWIILNIKDVTSLITDGVHATPEYVDEGIPFLSVNNLVNDRLYFANCKYITLETHHQLIKRCNPLKGDILMGKVATIGVSDVINTDREFSIFVQLALLKPLNNLINSYFLKYLTELAPFRHHINSFSSGTTIKYIGIKDIGRLKIPIPSLEQQDKIVDILSIVDEEINLSKSLLEKIHEQKRGLMQKLLTGEWRVNTEQSIE